MECGRIPPNDCAGRRSPRMTTNVVPEWNVDAFPRMTVPDGAVPE